MKRSKKKAAKLAGRIKDWENTVSRDTKLKASYRKPGSNK